MFCVHWDGVFSSKENFNHVNSRMTQSSPFSSLISEKELYICQVGTSWATGLLICPHYISTSLNKCGQRPNTDHPLPRDRTLTRSIYIHDILTAICDQVYCSPTGADIRFIIGGGQVSAQK